MESSVGLREQAIDSIIIQNHPIFNKLRKVTSTKYRIFFTNWNEMLEWLISRNWNVVDKTEWSSQNTSEFTIKTKDSMFRLHIPTDIFDANNGNLTAMLPENWNENSVRITKVLSKEDLDDDIPF